MNEYFYQNLSFRGHIHIPVATHNVKWVVPKKIHSPHTEEISAVRGGGEGNHLKNVLNLYRMSGEGEGGIVNFLRRGGGGSFLE